ncbi:MAG: FecR domain-containing protein [Pirellulaceae bacterium]|nr:FecR domain-containing protein [Pirellulaceae bacterium]
MSSPLSSSEIAEMRRLLQFLGDGRIDHNERARLQRWVCENEEAAWLYVQYMNLRAGLCWDMAGESEPSRDSGTEPGSSTSPVLGLLGEYWDQGVAFLLRPNVSSFLLAIGLPAIICLTFVVALVNRRPPEWQGSVASITRLSDYSGELEDRRVPLVAGTPLLAGQRLTVRKGLVEIEFACGARAILEAPTTLDVRDRNRAYLPTGRLSASVPPAASGFTVETPLAIVTDLGTEFGIRVDADGTAEAHVFRGVVELATKTEAENTKSLTTRLGIGQAARISTANGLPTSPQIERVAASPDEFILQFPIDEPKTPRAEETERGRLIASVERRGGVASDRVPIGPFDGETTPLLGDERGLRPGAHLYSDRVYFVASLDEALQGAEYVRPFNSDKEDQDREYDITVTFSTDREEVYLMLFVDDRVESRTPGQQQPTVDRVVSRFASPGDFVDSGRDLRADHTVKKASQSFSAFGMTVPTKDSSGKPIVYTFSPAKQPPGNHSHYIIAVLPEAPSE